MKMTSADVENLRAAFSIARTAGIDAVVITGGLVRGIAPTAKMALISPANVSFDESFKIGIGRIAELEKRLMVFQGSELTIEGKTNDANDVSVLTIMAGKTKLQFRCTAEKLIKYPKGNEDPEVATLTLNRIEVQQLARAVKTLQAETLTLAIGRDMVVKFECSSPTNEAFATELATVADFKDDPQAIVHIYEGDRLATVLDAAARDSEEVRIVVGEFGSLTLTIKGHTLVALPEANQEDDDE